MEVKDITYTEDLLTKGGDFIVEESEQQHIQDIVFSSRGDFRQFPLVGVGITSTLNSNENIDVIRKRVKNQLNYDNFDVSEVELLEDKSIRIVAKQRINEN